MKSEKKHYALLNSEVPQLAGFENRIVAESDSLREIRREAKRLGLRGFVIARRSVRRHGGDGAFLAV